MAHVIQSNYPDVWCYIKSDTSDDGFPDARKVKKFMLDILNFPNDIIQGRTLDNCELIAKWVKVNGVTPFIIPDNPDEIVPYESD
jgi:hypothetical protein